MGVVLKLNIRDKKPDTKGLCPIAISIRGNGQEKYYYPGIKVLPAHFKDGIITKDVKNHDLLNAKLKKLISETERTILARELEGVKMSVDEVKNLLAPDSGGMFLPVARAIIAEKDAPTRRRYNIEADKIEQYAGRGLKFGQITPQWLSAYYKYLTSKVGDKAPNSHNTAINAFKVIRHVIIRARKDKLTTIDPFKEWDYPQYKAPKRSYLTMAEVDKIFAILESDHSEDIKLVTAFFLLEVFSGIRVSDWNKFSIEKMVVNEDMIFTTTKTDTPVRIPVDIMPSLKRVVDYIRENNLVYTKDGLFANEKLATIKELIHYDGKFTTHLARHTCASMLVNKGMTHLEIGMMLGITPKQVATYAHASSDMIRNAVKRVGGI